MSNFNFSGSEFSHLIKSKEWEIIEQSKNKILNDKNFPILKDFYLKNFWISRANQKDIFIFKISRENLLNIQLDKVEDALKGDITNALKSTNLLNLSSDFSVLNSENIAHDKTQELRQHLVESSKTGICYFLFGEEGINTFINGHETGDNIFLTTQDLLEYSKKFKIEEIKKAFEKYKNHHLSRDNVRVKFFESKNAIVAIFGEAKTANFKANKNLLRNSPESLFRDDLIDFLNENVQASFNSEMELLSSRKPIDIFTEKKGKLYFFEVKWLGTSKHAEKDEEMATPYVGNHANKRANEGVIQTLEYIEEVIEKMNRDLKCGYLVIFDARNDRQAIVYDDVNSVPDNLRKYHNDKFDKVDNLEVDNIHPAY
ncbi:MAG: hypothetical protein IPP32_14585 [Bacteroidetes bacterium]|nr:hypothetical protein [Bacteroidota bacterium]